VSEISLDMLNWLNYRHSLGYSQKGWTDGEIGALWMKHFDEQTHTEANGRARLLLVDGHNSHYTRAFLEHARKNNIHVLCYPAHGTHVYQGLDVAVFSILKRFWSEERDKREREMGEKVNKENFLAIYGAAHIRALTPEIISTAFRKTGVWPYDPGVITPAMMAPSLETSCEATLPIVPPTPVQLLTNLIRKVSEPAEVVESASAPNAAQHMPNSDAGPNMTHSPVKAALDNLKSTTAGFVISSSPIRSRSHLPIAPMARITPKRRPGTRYPELLNVEPETDREGLLQRALHRTEAREARHEGHVIAIQASLVLMQKYCDRVRSQLESHEKKTKKRGQGKNKRLHGDGLPQLLTGDEFFSRVVHAEEAHGKEVAEKEARKGRRDEHTKALGEWKARDDERKKRNEVKRDAWKRAVADWQAQRDLAKERGIKWTGGKKPTLGGVEKAEPRPKALPIVDEDEADELSGWEDDDDNE
jgi:hypothetical protein